MGPLLPRQVTAGGAREVWLQCCGQNLRELVTTGDGATTVLQDGTECRGRELQHACEVPGCCEGMTCTGVF